MTYDLRAGLAALGREERDAAPALPVDALTSRAHRLRTTHAATYSAIGVGAAAVLTLGAITADGLLLDRDPAPVPPATERPRETAEPRVTPTATPTPTPTPTATEVAWEPSWELCGMPTEDLYARETAWDWESEAGWWIESMWPYDTTVPVDGLLPLTLSVNGPEVAEVTLEVQLTEVVALETDYTSGAGQVAGVAAMPTGDLVRGRGTEEDAVSLGPIETRIVSCAASPLTGGDGALDTSLTGEGYDVMTVTDIRPDGGDTVTAVAYVGHIGKYPPEADPPEGPATWSVREINDTATTVPLDAPYRVAKSTGWGHVDLAPTATMEREGWAIVQLCGTSSTPMPPFWLATTGQANGWLGVPPEGTTSPFSVSATGFRDADELIVQVTTTNNGSTVDDAWIASPGVTVVKDGLIIGYRYLWNTPFAPTRWSTGHTVQLEFDLGQAACTFVWKGQPWPAGTYEVYVHQNMDVLAQPGYPEPWRYDVVGGPFTFTLD